MTSTGRRQPLVKVIYSVPLLCEAIASVLDNIADVLSFPGCRGDTLGLLGPCGSPFGHGLARAHARTQSGGSPGVLPSNNSTRR